MPAITNTERTELLRRTTPGNAIASNEAKGLMLTLAMRNLLERKNPDLVTGVAFDREVLAIARSDAWRQHPRTGKASCPTV